MKLRKLLKCRPCKGEGRVPNYISAADVLKNGKFVNAKASFTTYHMCGHCMGRGHR